ncbi:MAG TPA: response regulator [Candidatus Lokiarchaeia archaeon]|nr:response regulator [Candidatus Lokiarchaeia archaeon]
MLIVDDDDTFLQFISTIVKTRYPLLKVQVAFDGEQALAITSKGKPPEVVITDIAMPRLDGNGLCNALRERHGKRVKIIAITANRLSVDAEFDCILPKPFSVDTFFAAIDAMLAIPRHD